MLSVDLEGLEDEVKPKMKETSKKLRSVAVLLSDLIIPEDFKYRDKIKNMPDKIFNVEEEVKDDQKWLDTCITGFYNAEGSNKSIIDRIGNLASTTAGNFADDASSLVTKAVSNVSSAGESIMWEVFGLNENLLDKACDILDYAGDAVRDTGATVINAGKYLYNKAKPVIDIAKKVGASIANVFVGLAKGISKVLEGLLDFATLVGSAILTQFTGPIDMARMGLYYLTGNLDEYKSWTGGMWKKTMSFVSTKHVENAFSSFYKKNAIGKWLDKNAYETFKSDGQGTKIAEGIGEVIGIVGVSIFTFGGGAVASAGTATAVGIGEHTEDAWAKMKENSFEGIKEKYKNGEITEEQYNSYVAIRELTDDQWKEIVLDYQNGEISEEQFKAMQQIREMPDDWRTAENALKGIFYGAANGVWEGVQWYVGGKLGNWAIEGKKLATSAVRVAADSVFNAADTPFRAAIDMIASDKDFKTAWEEQGGWNSVLTNFGIGLLGSAGGEALDNLGGKIGKNAGLDDIADVPDVEKIGNKLNDIKTPSIENIPNVSRNFDINSSKIKSIDEAIELTLRKKGLDITPENVRNLREKINNGEFNWITRADGARDTVIALKTIDDAIELTLKKHDIEITPENVNMLKERIFEGDFSVITRENGAREKVKNLFKKQENVTPVDINNKQKIQVGPIETIDDAIKLTLSKQGREITPEAIRELREKINQGDFNCITRTNGARDTVKKLFAQEREDILSRFEPNIKQNVNQTDTDFKYLSEGDGLYGIDQGIFKKLYRTPEHYEIKNKIMRKYNMSGRDVERLMSALDSIGACSYADVANEIVGFFKTQPEVFEEIFGMPLYKSTPGGKIKINDAEILVDMYIFANHEDNGGKLIIRDKSTNKNIINIEEIENIYDDRARLRNSDSQNYMQFGEGMNDYLINKYIHSKYDKIEYNSDVLKEVDNFNFNKENMDKLKEDVSNKLKEGKQVSMYVARINKRVQEYYYKTRGIKLKQKEIRFIKNRSDVISTGNWSEGGAHAVYITGLNDKGFIVSTWGDRRLVPYEDLQDGGRFAIFSSNLSKIERKENMINKIKNHIKRE